MRFRRLSVTLALLVSAATLAGAQGLTEPQIEAAIKAGLAKKSLAVQGRAGLFTIVIEGPMARIAKAANTAAQEFKPFLGSQVTTEMRSETVTVSAWPDAPTIFQGRISPTPDASHVVLMPKGTSDPARAIQPLNKNQFPQQFGNALGAKVESQGITADFNLADLPAGEFDVVIVAANGVDHRRSIKKGDRQKIQ